VIARSPELASLCARIDAQRGHLQQAGLAPNPELHLEVEEFGGTGSVAGADAAELTLLASQRLETAGKRGKRQRVAQAGLELERLEYQIARAERLAAAELAFAQVLAAQARLQLLEELVQSATSSLGATQRLVAAGAASPIETTRAAVERAATEVQRASGRRDLAAARARLAATWGAVAAELGRVEGALELVPEFAEPDARRLIEDSPRLALLGLELARRQAVVVLEDARAVPDVTVAAGVRRLEEVDDVAFVAGVSAPLALFDRNQGARAAARAGVRSTRHDQVSARALLAAELARELAELRAREAEVAQLRQHILPGSTQAFDGVRQGYAQGRFRSLDVIDAQRRLFELRLSEIDALRAHAEARAAIRRLTGLER